MQKLSDKLEEHMDGHIQFRVPCPVQEKQELVVVALGEQIVGEQNHQRLV